MLHSPISERMRNVYQRMRVERRTGVSPADKDVFLALCQEQEQSGLTASAQNKETEEVSDWGEISWDDFGNWHDAPQIVVRNKRS